MRSGGYPLTFLAATSAIALFVVFVLFCERTFLVGAQREERFEYDLHRARAHLPDLAADLRNAGPVAPALAVLAALGVCAAAFARRRRDTLGRIAVLAVLTGVAGACLAFMKLRFLPGGSYGALETAAPVFRGIFAGFRLAVVLAALCAVAAMFFHARRGSPDAVAALPMLLGVVVLAHTVAVGIGEMGALAATVAPSDAPTFLARRAPCVLVAAWLSGAVIITGRLPRLAVQPWRAALLLLVLAAGFVAAVLLHWNYVPFGWGIEPAFGAGLRVLVPIAAFTAAVVVWTAGALFRPRVREMTRSAHPALPAAVEGAAALSLLAGLAILAPMFVPGRSGWVAADLRPLSQYAATVHGIAVCAALLLLASGALRLLGSPADVPPARRA
jgi:hypothetical protein